MPAIKTRADSLREYLTGATADGGAQPNPSLSLGNYRSSTEAVTYGILLANALSGVTLDYASGDNFPGDGLLTCVDANNVSWRDSVSGIGVRLNLPSNGSQGIAETYENPGAFVRVTRISAGPIAGGPCTVTLTALFNNFYGMDDVPAADATSGINQYRASILRNEAAAAVTNVKRWINPLGSQRQSQTTQLPVSGDGLIVTADNFDDWPQSGWVHIKSASRALKEIAYYTDRTNNSLTVVSNGRGLLGTVPALGAPSDLIDPIPGVAIGIGSSGIQAFGSPLQIISNPTTPPIGVVWNHGITESTGLNIGTLLANQQVGVWIWRQIPPGAVSTPDAKNPFTTAFHAA